MLWLAMDMFLSKFLKINYYYFYYFEKLYLIIIITIIRSFCSGSTEVELQFSLQNVWIQYI